MQNKVYSYAHLPVKAYLVTCYTVCKQNLIRLVGYILVHTAVSASQLNAIFYLFQLSLAEGANTRSRFLIAYSYPSI